MMAGPSHLKPGEEGLISVRVAIPNKAGALAETVAVKSNDPMRPKVILTVLATIVENLMSPNQLNNILK